MSPRGEIAIPIQRKYSRECRDVNSNGARCPPFELGSVRVARRLRHVKPLNVLLAICRQNEPRVEFMRLGGRGRAFER